MESEVLTKKPVMEEERAVAAPAAHFSHLKEFYLFSEELAMVWFVTEAFPYCWNSARSCLFGKHSKCCLKGTYLYTEANYCLWWFREPKNYKLIFKAIASALTRLENMHNTGLDKSMVSKYLDVLRACILSGRNSCNSFTQFKRRLIWSRSLLHFWFRYVYPNRIDLEAGRTKR